MRPKEAPRNDSGEKKSTARKDKQRSPLDGILEDPSPKDRGFFSLDKALWDPTRTKHGPERAAKDED
jgi:hypothetical protein